MQLSLVMTRRMAMLLVWLLVAVTIDTDSTTSALKVQPLHAVRQLPPSTTERHRTIRGTGRTLRKPLCGSSPTALPARRGGKGAGGSKAPVEDEGELDKGLLNVLQAEVFLATVPLLLLAAYIAVGLNLSSP